MFAFGTSVLLTAFFNACGPGLSMAPSAGSSGTFSSDGLGTAAGFQAFKSTFYTYTQTQGCVMCHGGAVSPKFAQPDSYQAYQEALGYQIGSTTLPLIDFSNPDGALFISYAGNNHCGQLPCADPNNSAVVKTLIQQWAAAEVAGGGGQSTSTVKFKTATMTMPATIPASTSATPGVIRFDLSKLNPTYSTFNNAILELEVQMVNPTEYRFAKPKIVGATAATTITGMHVYVNGQEDHSQGSWDGLTIAVPVSTKPATLPTGPINQTPLLTTAMYAMMTSATDMIQIGFDDLSGGTAGTGTAGGATPTPTPSGVQTFSQLIAAGGVFAVNCQSCHNAANAQGSFNITVYAQAKAQAATIADRVTNAGAPMPTSGLLPVATRTIITNWVNAGAPQ